MKSMSPDWKCIFVGLFLIIWAALAAYQGYLLVLSILQFTIGLGFLLKAFLSHD